MTLRRQLSEFDDDLFEESKRNKPYLSRSQKRTKRIEHGLVRAQDPPLNKSEVRGIVDSKELRKLQQTDDTLKHVRAEAAGMTEPSNTGFFERDGLIYRRWVPAKREAEEYRDQLVLPNDYRHNVLHIATLVDTLERRKRPGELWTGSIGQLCLVTLKTIAVAVSSARSVP